MQAKGNSPRCHEHSVAATERATTNKLQSIKHANVTIKMKNKIKTVHELNRFMDDSTTHSLGIH